MGVNMPSKVTLKASNGDWRENFVFEERDSCMIGRSKDCWIRVPASIDQMISRRHCLMDINPPDIRIRDYGSLNGTRINGKVIGRRKKGLSAEEGIQLAEGNATDHDLAHGDTVKLGNTVFEVEVFLPILCMDCSREIPEEKTSQANVMTGIYRCETCRQTPQLEPRSTSSVSSGKRCAQCGCDVSREMGKNRRGEYICAVCQSDPFQILLHLLNLAKSGQQDLLSIQGYTIEKELGRGGMGAVYLARHDRTGERVALKVMLPQVAADQHGKEKFLREVETMKLLHHKNIVELRDHGCSEGVFYFTLEFCNAGSLDHLVKQHGGKLPVPQAAAIALQILDGLKYAHRADVQVPLEDGSHLRAKGVVHRDLKPPNILLTSSGKNVMVKIGDFGLSKAFDTAGLSGQTRTGSVAGTPLFMPRQQVLNFKYARPDIDVWAAAACFYHMLTGAFPRDFPSSQDVWQRILQYPPLPILQREASIPKRLAQVIDTALQEKPRIGFKTAADLQQAIQEAL